MSGLEETAAFNAVKEIVRRAVLTLSAIQDPDARFRRGHQSSWTLPVVRDAAESYGYGAPSLARFVPTPRDVSQMEVVATWLAWLRRTEGEGALRRIIGWAKGIPGWSLGMKERCSERTIKNRIDRSIAAIIRQFAAVDLVVELIDEEMVLHETLTPRQGRANGPFSMVLEKPEGGSQVILRKVYIHDVGFVIGPKRLRNGHHKAERMMARA